MTTKFDLKKAVKAPSCFENGELSTANLHKKKTIRSSFQPTYDLPQYFLRLITPF